MSEPCTTCSNTHPRCRAHNRAGNPCGNQPITGATVCRIHGGAAPQTLDAAARRLAQAEAARAVAKDAHALLAHEAVVAVDNPLEQLALLAREALAWKAALAARVNALTNVRYEDMKGSEQLRSEVTLYERALDRTASLLEKLARLGYDERRVRLDEQRGELVALAITRILDALNLTPEQQQRVPEVVPAQLRLIAGGAA